MSLYYSIVKNLLKTSMSLAEIQSTTGSSLPTVRRAVQALSDARWIRVVGQAEADGGRPAMLFGIHNESSMILGLHLQLPGMQITATDLSGKVLETIEFFSGTVPEPSEVVRAVVDIVQILKARFPDRRVLGIGIAAPGYIDPHTGDIIAIGRVPSWVNFPICQRLYEATGLPVQIANDVDCLAIAELNFDNCILKKNVVYVAFCEGFKASLFLGGDLYKGTLGNVGLISSELLNVTNEMTPEENKRLITLSGFVDVFKERVALLEPSAQRNYRDILELADQHKCAQQILNNSEIDQRICYPLVQDLIQILSVWIASMILFVQPDVLVVGGLLSSLPTNLFLDLESSIRSHIPALLDNKIIIKQGVMDSKNNSAIGAIHHFLRNNLEELLEVI